MNKLQKNKAVFLITIDALRADHLKSYGYFRNIAPNLEKFAKKGTIFLNVITNGPETPTSFSSIFTSILPFLDGGYSPLPNQKITLAQLLKESGIFTYSIHSNPNLGRFFNYDRGFDVFLDGERYKKQSKDSFKQVISFYLKKLLKNKGISNKLMYRIRGFNKVKSWVRKKIPFLTELLLPFTPIAYNAPYIVNKLLSFLNTSKKPFFVWAHFMDVHSPYNPPTQNVLNFRKRDFNIKEREFLIRKVYSKAPGVKITSEMVEDLKTLYDSQINFVDEYLVKFLGVINTRFKDNCLIIITADHGESFYEHGFFGHQGSVFEEILKVPLIMVELGKIPEIDMIPNNVQLIDITPTILDYFGIEIPENFQGKSLLPLVKGDLTNQNRIFISECYQNKGLMKRNRDEGFILLAIRKLKWKYIFNEEKNLEFLFDLEEDPQEENSLVNEYSEKLNEFRMIRDYHLKQARNLSKEKIKISKAIDSNKLY